jgi:hypothetical protein
MVAMRRWWLLFAHRMTRFHDKLLQECQPEPNSDTVKPDAARPGSLMRRVE